MKKRKAKIIRRKPIRPKGPAPFNKALPPAPENKAGMRRRLKASDFAKSYALVDRVGLRMVKDAARGC